MKKPQNPEKSPLEQVLEILTSFQDPKPASVKPTSQGNFGVVQFLLIFLATVIVLIATS